MKNKEKLTILYGLKIREHRQQRWCTSIVVETYFHSKWQWKHIKLNTYAAELSDIVKILNMIFKWRYNVCTAGSLYMELEHNLSARINILDHQHFNTKSYEESRISNNVSVVMSNAGVVYLSIMHSQSHQFRMGYCW